MKKIGIINCGFGNTASIINAIEYLNFDYKILKSPENLDELTHLILPGVGSFNNAAKKLREFGWPKAIKHFISDSKPFLGICLGMQLMFERSSENGNEEGLALFQGNCEPFSKKTNIKTTHIGFSPVDRPNPKSKIWKDIPNNSPFYFIHSYRVLFESKANLENYLISKTIYGDEFISFIEKDKIFGAQFHPEKSHYIGISLIKNFIEEIK